MPGHGETMRGAEGPVRAARIWTILNSIYARARRRPGVTMFGFSRQGR